MRGAWPTQVLHLEVIVERGRVRPLEIWALSSQGVKQSGCPVGAALPRRSLWQQMWRRNRRGQEAVVGTTMPTGSSGEETQQPRPRGRTRAPPVNRKVPTQPQRCDSHPSVRSSGKAVRAFLVRLWANKLRHLQEGELAERDEAENRV